MTTVIYLTGAILALSALFLMAWIVARVYLRFRGTMLVTCPETSEPAAVEVDARHAAFTAPLGEPGLRLKSCSRWPESQGCSQECLNLIESGPKECLVRTILTKWYEGKSCIFCGKALGEITWLEQPAMMSPDRVTFEWKEIPGERVPEVIETHMPVCWNCHVAETFRRVHPELVLSRPSKRGGSHQKN